jgi:GNAT superfamily N-acetyltransferase
MGCALRETHRLSAADVDGYRCEAGHFVPSLYAPPIYSPFIRDQREKGQAPMQFRWCRFEEFGCDELYAVLALRQSILVVEQSSPYPDMDFVDQVADHLLVTDSDVLIGYARCHGPLPGNACASFGRLAVAPHYRGTGLGKELVGFLRVSPTDHVAIFAWARSSTSKTFMDASDSSATANPMTTRAYRM